MGDYEGWAQPPSGLLLNGLLPNEEASVIRVLDSERWSKAEERTAELIACIQPNQFSEDRRKAVADYVQRLIVKSFSCQVQVFTFGSVPLKTYLPDGDIDLTAFSENQTLKDSWAHQVCSMLESEEKNEKAEFCVKEVQYIQAEVKIIKCLVENIVVDISFNQLGGLCTLCFLEEVDSLIKENHLFKRSIILIKAWCYYESRILGAHHGLISTYALETLVLYIFHVYHKKLTGPLEVLYHFLEFFSKFDWDNFCVSLWGPVPVCSLPDVAAEPPRKDDAELLLTKRFLDACGDVYAVLPGGQENQGQPFVSKHFNVIDPLRINNNLGRSVSKGNFFRIRSAFAFGAKRLARLLDCPREGLLFEVNQFFMNTWDRHGSGHRPDAPSNDLLYVRISNPDKKHASENMKHNSSKKKSENFPCNTQVEKTQASCAVSSQHSNFVLESTYSNKDVSTVSRAQSQKSSVNQKNSSDKVRQEISSNQGTDIGKGQQNCKPDIFLNDNQRMILFARTHSSPELVHTYGEDSFQVTRSRATESGNSQSITRLDRNNLESDGFAHHNRSSAEHSSVHQISSHEDLDIVRGSSSPLYNYYASSGLGVMDNGLPSTPETQRMHQEDQDVWNMMTLPTANNFSGQVPHNLASGHLPLSIPPSVLASYRRNLTGIVPTNIPSVENPWGTNMQFRRGLVSSQLIHYFPGIGSTSNTEDLIESGYENYRSTEVGSAEVNNDFWHEDDRGSNEGIDLDNGKLEMMYFDDKQQPASAGYNFVPLSRLGSSSSTTSARHKITTEKQGSTWENHVDKSQYKENSGSEVSIDDRTTKLRSLPAEHGNSSRSKTSSECSWEGSASKSLRETREKRVRKTASSALSPDLHRQGSLSEHSSQADPETTERITGSQSVDCLHAPTNQIPSSEPSQGIGSDTLMPMGPVLLNPDSCQRPMDNHGVIPFTFYPTGPPVPFVTMLPLYNFPTETGTSDSAAMHLAGDDELGNTELSHKFDSLEGDQSEVIRTNTPITGAISVEPSAQKSDILSSDFQSHWYNLQYGRHCQNPRYPPPMIYPSPVMVPPVYLQGRFPWDGPGRPISANMNFFTQLMSCGPPLVPLAPSVSSRPGGVYQHFIDEMPRHRNGTGTYLPNPKASVRDRQMPSTRRGNYSYDRSDHDTDRDGNRRNNSKSRARSHGPSQTEKPRSRADRSAASESRAERSWSTNRHDSYPSLQSKNVPVRSNTQSTSASLANGMYPSPAMNHSGVSSNGPSIPPLVMLYPCDHGTSYGLPNERPEFGSLGSSGYSGVNDARLSEGSQSGEVFEEHRCDSAPVQQSSSKPSSPHIWRGV